jgi:hypothetical protein
MSFSKWLSSRTKDDLIDSVWLADRKRHHARERFGRDANTADEIPVGA